MIFQYTLQAVLNGEKTQTRRPVKPNEDAFYDDNGQMIAVLHKGRTKWQVGKNYGVQPSRTGKAVARIEIRSIKQESVQSVTDEDARKEGAKNREDFLNLWEDIHGENMRDADAWVLSFTLVEK